MFAGSPQASAGMASGVPQTVTFSVVRRMGVRSFQGCTEESEALRTRGMGSPCLWTEFPHSSSLLLKPSSLAVVPSEQLVSRQEVPQQPG